MTTPYKWFDQTTLAPLEAFPAIWLDGYLLAAQKAHVADLAGYLATLGIEEEDRTVAIDYYTTQQEGVVFDEDTGMVSYYNNSCLN